LDDRHTAADVTEVLACLEANRRGRRWTPDGFATLSAIDRVVVAAALLLDIHGVIPIEDESINAVVESIPNAVQRVNVFQFLKAVFRRLVLPNECYGSG
jgi:hypothetical protein